MAINMIVEDSSACSSPRISFSHDLPNENLSTESDKGNVEVIRLDRSLLLEASSEFKFCFTGYPDEKETCPADELFYNGVIIPIHMKQKLDSINGHSKEQEEEITAATTATLIREEKIHSKSFWRFTRSSSLNYDNNYGHKKSSFWSLPNLLRSKSTGSSFFETSNDQVIKQSSKSNIVSSNNNNSKLNNGNSGARLSFSSNNQKPPLKKSSSKIGGFGAGYSARNGYVLNNVPGPYIVKGTSDLFGFSSLIRNGSKDKKSKLR